MYWEITLSEPSDSSGGAHALDVNLFRLAELAAMFTLRDWSTLLLDLKERSVVVFAGRGAMPFDAGLAVEAEMRHVSKATSLRGLTMHISYLRLKPISLAISNTSFPE